MAKPIARADVELVAKAKEHALDLLTKAFAEARNRGKPIGTETTPPLFPNGIDHLRVKFDVGIGQAASLGVELELTGPRQAG